MKDTMTTALTPYVAPRLLSQAVEAALKVAGVQTSPGTVQVQPRCKALGRGDLQCVKEGGHGQRHRYGPKSVNPSAGHVAPPRPWVKAQEFVKKSGSRKYVIKVGYPCKVEGQRGTFKVIGIEKHAETGKVNVEVTQDRTGHSRVFTADKVIYKRPKKV